MLFQKKRIPVPKRSVPVTSVQTAAHEQPFARLESWVPVSSGERRLYDALRGSIPIVDAAIGKLLRLIGTFRVECPGTAAGEALGDFLRNVPVGAAGAGVQTFLDG